jgi:hypothetical protein
VAACGQIKTYRFVLSMLVINQYGLMTFAMDIEKKINPTGKEKMRGPVNDMAEASISGKV